MAVPPATPPAAPGPSAAQAVPAQSASPAEPNRPATPPRAPVLVSAADESPFVDNFQPVHAGPVMDLGPLRDCSLFHRLDLDELRRLWGVGKVTDLVAGAVLLKAGESSDGIFVLISGGLTITPDPTNLNLAVGFLGPSDYVGLGCLVQGPPRPNALVAQGATRLLFLPTDGLETFLSSEPDLGMRLFRSIAEHLSQTLMAQQKR